ncbi:MAG: hypothetical protein KGJ23_08105 [Euryarchaeota archaeon]|nr:hypothetical protein [Euryarchaeota archaeon]MDE1836564.1 hypothetical protein [Euryarchaeota archaeon]MDE1879241.1 hypothetical protein [Euryarchaeota archaeon]MDE2044534.1 hypothetical protein [Thermoplasmata archaeon]
MMNGSEQATREQSANDRAGSTVSGWVSEDYAEGDSRRRNGVVGKVVLDMDNLKASAYGQGFTLSEYRGSEGTILGGQVRLYFSRKEKEFGFTLNLREARTLVAQLQEAIAEADRQNARA